MNFGIGMYPRAARARPGEGRGANGKGHPYLFSALGLRPAPEKCLGPLLLYARFLPFQRVVVAFMDLKQRAAGSGRTIFAHIMQKFIETLA